MINKIDGVNNSENLKKIAKIMGNKTNKHITPQMITKLNYVQSEGIKNSYVVRIGTTAIFYEDLEDGNFKVRYMHW